MWLLGLNHPKPRHMSAYLAITMSGVLVFPAALVNKAFCGSPLSETFILFNHVEKESVVVFAGLAVSYAVNAESLHALILPGNPIDISIVSRPRTT